MREPVWPILGVYAADPQLRRVVNDAAASVGARAHEVPDLLAAAAPDMALAALFCQRHPRHGLSAQAVTAFRERCPATPVLIYISDPEQDVFEEFVATVVRLPGVVFEVRRHAPDETARIGAALRGLLRQAPVWQALSVIDAAFGRTPAVIRDFVLSGLRAHAGGGPERSVRELCSGLGVSARTLERRARDAKLPGPSELMDWAALLFWLAGPIDLPLGYGSVAHGRRDRSRIATIRRLRGRLPGTDRDEPDFELVARVFAERIAAMRLVNREPESPGG